jgi:hypothetical protein
VSALTAVELGSDICALARASVHADGVHVHAAETLDPAAFPGGGTFAGALRASRKKLKLPRRCRVVLWGFPEGASRRDPSVKPRLAPLEGAGFHVERVVSPCNALAALARLKTSRGENATCWLAVNRGGVAIVVVRPGKQLYSHSFTWDWTLGNTGSQARLLQRYSLVASLAPEVKRAMSVARQHGTPVDAIVTCGNLPDLRSLTMPLIEELDVEVETLDSLDGLVVKKDAADRLTDLAPAIRLACAGAATRSSRPWDGSRKWKSRAERALLYAATIVAVAAVGYAWYAWTHRPAPSPFENRTPPPAQPPAQPPRTQPPAQIPRTQAPSTAPTVQPPPAHAPTSGTTRPSPEDARPQTPKPQTPKAQTPAPQSPAPQTAAPQTPAAQRSAPRTAPPPKTPPPQRPAPRTAPVDAPPRTSAVNTPAVPADNPPARPAQPAVRTTAEQPGRAEPAAPSPSLPPRLSDPVPRVATILVSGDRRYATVDGGQIVGIGDILGRRTVVAIDERSVVFREPSGLHLRVGLGGRVLSVGPGGQ